MVRSEPAGFLNLLKTLLRRFGRLATTKQRISELLLIDDCENGDGITCLGTSWFTYNDNGLGGNSEVVPTPDAFRMTKPGCNDSQFCAQMTGVVRLGFEQGFVGMGFYLQEHRSLLDISKYNGLRFYAKGDGKRYQVRVHCSSTVDWDDYCYVFTAPTNWRLFEVPFSVLSQEGWGKKTFWTGRDAISIAWQTVGQPYTSIQLAIDDVAFYVK